MDNMKIYKDYMRYGKILSCVEFDLSSDRRIVTVKSAILNGVKRLFILCNGEVVYCEIVGKIAEKYK